MPSELGRILRHLVSLLFSEDAPYLSREPASLGRIAD